MPTASLVLRIVAGLTLVLALAESLAAAQDAERGLKPIFNGKNLTGWDGDPLFWKVEGGVLIGRSTEENPCKRNTFLIYRSSKSVTSPPR